MVPPHFCLLQLIICLTSKDSIYTNLPKKVTVSLDYPTMGKWVPRDCCPSPILGCISSDKPRGIYSDKPRGIYTHTWVQVLPYTLWENIHNIKFTIFTTLRVQFSSIKYIHIIVQPSPSCTSRTWSSRTCTSRTIFYNQFGHRQQRWPLPHRWQHFIKSLSWGSELSAYLDFLEAATNLWSWEKRILQQILKSFRGNKS